MSLMAVLLLVMSITTSWLICTTYYQDSAADERSMLLCHGRSSYRESCTGISDIDDDAVLAVAVVVVCSPLLFRSKL